MGKISQENINKIIELRNQKLSIKKIATECNVSIATVDKYLKKYNLNIQSSFYLEKNIKKEIINLYKNNISVIDIGKSLNINKNTIYKILKKENIIKKEIKTKSEHVLNWKKRTKQKLVDYKGGKCIICNYNKCISALEFHHLNPKEKDFGISNNSFSFDKMKQEVDKCILVCSNCHREIHYGLINISELP